MWHELSNLVSAALHAYRWPRLSWQSLVGCLLCFGLSLKRLLLAYSRRLTFDAVFPVNMLSIVAQLTKVHAFSSSAASWAVFDENTFSQTLILTQTKQVVVTRGFCSWMTTVIILGHACASKQSVLSGCSWAWPVFAWLQLVCFPMLLHTSWSQAVNHNHATLQRTQAS